MVEVETLSVTVSDEDSADEDARVDDVDPELTRSTAVDRDDAILSDARGDVVTDNDVSKDDRWEEIEESRAGIVTDVDAVMP
ncbi:hypothetical protein ACOMHN_048702 [Nucella lapillus]